MSSIAESTKPTQPKILNGKWLAAQYHQIIRDEADRLRPHIGRAPGLGVIIVGNDPASKTYVRNKEKVARTKCGFHVVDVELPADASDAEIVEEINCLNKDNTIDGILLQLPLPKGRNEKFCLDSIDPRKDADGLHPLNQGLLVRGEGKLRSCTPMGCLKLIDLAYSDIDPQSKPKLTKDIPSKDLSGKNAVVIGRSLLVGKPMAHLLLERNATVSIAHSRTKNIEKICRQADILVAAVGVPKMVKADWVKDGAVVIDVGINQLDDGSLVGDVDFEAVMDKTLAITPVPGGVGPMTITFLMMNTLNAFKRKFHD
ncbi:MAG: bifunctional methylenetetrahydrofolate dehydrogenase/methenyltetrahydrofolate cyclohydrolase FolD [Bdellovibrionales bacterium]|nr:bifunctional methylenetetrahydrofolate dehydrogenase/methenyltetrahydrofolate cyclohydrolase FolD [Bdellovibrionales bacterium]